MKRAVDDFKRSVKDVDSKLDMLEWKVRTLCDQSVGNNESITENSSKTLSELLEAVPRVTKEYEDTVQKVKEAKEDVQLASVQLTNKLDSLHSRFKKISDKITSDMD